MTDELDKLSDAQLSEVFAVEVAGFTGIRDSRRYEVSDEPPAVVRLGIHPTLGKMALPDFVTSLDALLSHMEQQRLSILRMGYNPPQWLVYSQNPVVGEVRNPSLARAICIVLILISRAEMAEDKARHRSEHPLGTEGKP